MHISFHIASFNGTKMTTPRPTLGTPLLEGMLIRLIIISDWLSSTDLTLPKPKREFLKTSFKYSGAMLWNQLPNEVKLAESIYSFNKCIKT